jgi:3-oxoacyl-[acyl-carrier-protein] synthase II
VPRLLINLAAGHVSMRHGFTGASLAPATACTTGTHAVADALRLLRNAEGNPDAPQIVLAGAAEACVVPLAMAGFARARSLATPFDGDDHADEEAAARASSRPFDAARSGFVLAEGAAVLVIETLPHALARGVPPEAIVAELAGAGCASDAWHATAPHPGGRGARLAMERALRDARADPKQVDWVCAHATGTRAGDAAENRAVRSVMLGDGLEGEDRARFKTAAGDVNVSSVKGALGHLLGAAGAVEAAFAALAVRDDVLPPTANLESPGDGDGVWDMNYVARVKQDARVDVAVSNSAGFGGTCASVVFKKFRA